jgi:hypothetical protein
VDKGMSSELCEQCGNRLTIIEASFQCERKCQDCGKNFYICEVGENGQGMKIMEGDRVLASAGAINISLEREITTSRFSRHGISWYAQTLYYMHQVQQLEEVKHMLSKFEEEAVSILKMSPLLGDLDLCKDEDGAKIIEIVTSTPNTREHFAYEMLMGSMYSKTCIDENNAQEAILAMSRLMNARSMIIFKDTFEKLIWSGYLVGDLKDLLKTWETNKDNKDEKFWEEVFCSNQLVLSQVFSFPVTIFQNQAYVGGKGINNVGGNYVDFLIKNPISENILLLEIKTPKSQLLVNKPYRKSVYSIHSDLVGAVIQVSTQRDSLLKEYHQLKNNYQRGFQALHPQCLVIAGNLDKEVMDDPIKRNSFELFRNGLKDVQIITYDELFCKIKILLDLFEST